MPNHQVTVLLPLKLTAKIARRVILNHHLVKEEKELLKLEC